MDSPDIGRQRLVDSDDEEPGWFSPKRRCFRFLGLMLMCFLGFGNFIYFEVF